MPAAAPPYRTIDVDTPDGVRRAGCWGDGAPVVLAVHGITANHLCWAPLARALGDRLTLLAPDLRGRGRSPAGGGPSGLAAHADDLVRLLDQEGVERAVVVGHSMGGFVATVAAVRRPDRVAALLLVDGGLPLPVPDVDVDAAVRVSIGPARDRLDRTFESRSDYRAYWRAHPAFQPPGAWTPDVEAYVDYDLVGEPPQLRSSVSISAITADAADMLTDPASAGAITRVSCPAVLVRARRGLLDQVPPLYPDERVAQLLPSCPTIDEDLTVDANHYTIVLGEAGAAVLAGAVCRLVQE